MFGQNKKNSRNCHLFALIKAGGDNAQDSTPPGKPKGKAGEKNPKVTPPPGAKTSAKKPPGKKTQRPAGTGIGGGGAGGGGKTPPKGGGSTPGVVTGAAGAKKNKWRVLTKEEYQKSLENCFCRTEKWFLVLFGMGEGEDYRCTKAEKGQTAVL